MSRVWDAAIIEFNVGPGGSERSLRRRDIYTSTRTSARRRSPCTAPSAYDWAAAAAIQKRNETVQFVHRQTAALQRERGRKKELYSQSGRGRTINRRKRRRRREEGKTLHRKRDHRQRPDRYSRSIHALRSDGLPAGLASYYANWSFRRTRRGKNYILSYHIAVFIYIYSNENMLSCREGCKSAPRECINNFPRLTCISGSVIACRSYSYI